MALPLLSNEYVTKTLEQLHCVKLMAYGTVARWMTRTGFHFTVPEEGPYRQCAKYDFEAILEMIKPHL